MATRSVRCIVITIFLVAALSFSAPAQSTVTIGNAYAALAGPWKFHTGDNMAWAAPNFDDSAWGTMDLTPLPGAVGPDHLRTPDYVPGWTARGYAGYSGYAWYRLRLNLQEATPGPGARLALKMPERFDDAYQVYIDGQLVEQFGRFTRQGVTFYQTQPRAFPLPGVIHGGPMTIAIRMWMSNATLRFPEVGGLHGPPVLGQASVIQAMLRISWERIYRGDVSMFLERLILLLVLLAAFGLFWLDREEPAYLWLGLTCTTILLQGILGMLGHYTAFSETSYYLSVTAVGYPVVVGLWVLFWAHWFRLDRMASLYRAVGGLVLLLILANASLFPPFYGRSVPVHAVVWLLPLLLVLKLLLGALLVWVTYRGIRRNRAEGWLALPAVALVAVSLYQTDLRLLHIANFFYPFGFAIALGQIGTILSLAIITVLMLRRFLQGQRQREQWRVEMEQARQVQQLLVPATAPLTPGFQVESVYLPASSVGGDFFQISPGEDGSLLIIVGDVSGKGLKAAMTVSAIVGGLRQIATREPAELLAALSRQLVDELNGGFVTCCATLIDSRGKATIANAGHLSPYCNGKELAVGTGIPLGIDAAGEYEETECELAPGDRLTFISDGVVEARNAKGELYGFERTEGLSGQPAAVIADTVRQFGQEDDITVVSITWAAEPPSSAASAQLSGEETLELT